jgi:hypothetical protein
MIEVTAGVWTILSRPGMRELGSRGVGGVHERA